MVASDLAKPQAAKRPLDSSALNVLWRTEKLLQLLRPAAVSIALTQHLARLARLFLLAYCFPQRHEVRERLRMRFGHRVVKHIDVKESEQRILRAAGFLVARA